MNNYDDSNKKRKSRQKSKGKNILLSGMTEGTNVDEKENYTKRNETKRNCIESTEPPEEQFKFKPSGSGGSTFVLLKLFCRTIIFFLRNVQFCSAVKKYTKKRKYKLLINL